MLQLTWQDERGSGGSHIASKFPLVIGRSAAAGLRMEAPGVWDSHAVVRHDRDTSKFAIASGGEGALLVNGERVTEKVLKPGDRVQLGGAVILVSLAPARSASLRPREAAFWTLFCLILVLEILLAGTFA
jgi:predicted component of type VI protein secretion system